MIVKCKITKKWMFCGFFSKISQTPKKTFEKHVVEQGRRESETDNFFLGLTVNLIIYNHPANLIDCIV